MQLSFLYCCFLAVWDYKSDSELSYLIKPLNKNDYIESWKNETGFSIRKSNFIIYFMSMSEQSCKPRTTVTKNCLFSWICASQGPQTTESVVSGSSLLYLSKAHTWIENVFVGCKHSTVSFWARFVLKSVFSALRTKQKALNVPNKNTL